MRSCHEISRSLSLGVSVTAVTPLIMLPPQYARSVQVTALEAPVKVTATYAGAKVRRVSL